MKILHVITLADLGGAQSVLINICNRAVKDGHQTYVISESEGPMWKQLDDKIIKIKINQLQREVNPLKDFLTLLQLRKIYKEIKPDVIHLHSSKIGLLGRLAFPAKRIIYTVHGFDSVRTANRKFLIFEKLLKNKARYIIAVSNYDKAALVSEGITKNVEMIYNGIKDTYTTNEGEVSLYASEYLENLHKNHIVIMTIARLSPPKDYQLFRNVADHFKNDERFKFVWIGNKEGNGSNTTNITMLGELVDAYVYLKYADLFLLPSKYEGLPISIIEAMCFGVPVIASNVGGISEILNNENGFAVENNVLDFKNAIEKIVNDREFFKSFCNEARLIYKKKFTIDKMYLQYMDLYKNVIIK